MKLDYYVNINWTGNIIYFDILYHYQTKKNNIIRQTVKNKS